MVQMMADMRWVNGGESMSSSQSDSRCVPANADASCWTYEPSEMNVMPLDQLGTCSSMPPPEAAAGGLDG